MSFVTAQIDGANITVLRNAETNNITILRVTTGLDSDSIDALIEAKIAALQASGDLPPDPATLNEGDTLVVNASNKYVAA